MYIETMDAEKYIASSRAYLDYIEEHLSNVKKAFDELTRACEGKMHWVGDDCAWHMFRREVERHDLSKLSKEEFCQYRDNFFPTCDADKQSSGYAEAWENHKKENHHHHETAEHYGDLTHMIIDWMAMGYKFKNCPYKYYKKIKHELNFKDEWHEYIEEVFSYLLDYRNRINKKRHALLSIFTR